MPVSARFRCDALSPFSRLVAMGALLAGCATPPKPPPAPPASKIPEKSIKTTPRLPPIPMVFQTISGDYVCEPEGVTGGAYDKITIWGPGGKGPQIFYVPEPGRLTRCTLFDKLKIFNATLPRATRVAFESSGYLDSATLPAPHWIRPGIRCSGVVKFDHADITGLGKTGRDEYVNTLRACTLFGDQLIEGVLIPDRSEIGFITFFGKASAFPIEAVLPNPIQIGGLLFSHVYIIFIGAPCDPQKPVTRETCTLAADHRIKGHLLPKGTTITASDYRWKVVLGDDAVLEGKKWGKGSTVGFFPAGEIM